MGWRWGWRGPFPGRGPFSYLPPWLRPGWVFGRGACWWLFGMPWGARWFWPYYTPYMMPYYYPYYPYYWWYLPYMMMYRYFMPYPWW